jgi:hypothetical protein
VPIELHEYARTRNASLAAGIGAGVGAAKRVASCFLRLLGVSDYTIPASKLLAGSSV